MRHVQQAPAVAPLAACGDDHAGGADLRATLDRLRPDGPGRWVADRHMGPGGAAGLDRVHGGEMVAHAVTLAQAQAGGRLCTTINIVFAREARWELPTEFELTGLSAGRSYSFTAVGISQPGRGVVAHAQVVLAAPRSGPSHQAAEVPDVDWSSAVDEARGLLSAPIAVVGGGRLDDHDAGEPVVRLWLRVPDALTDEAERRAYVAFASDQLMMSAAVRPHAGMGYVTTGVYAAVTGHSVRFWGNELPSTDLRFDITSPVMRDGVALAVAHAFDDSGALVATFVQDLIVRPQSVRPQSIDTGPGETR